MTQQGGQCRFPSNCKPVSLLPNRDRRAVTAELRGYSHHSALNLGVSQPNVYYEVLTRPAVLSRRQRAVTTSNAAYRLDKRCLEASALRSQSDSNVGIRANSHSLRMSRLKSEFVKSDVKLYRNVCFSKAADKVTTKNSALPSIALLSFDETACRQGDCHCVTRDTGKRGNTETQSAIISQHDNKSGSLTHIASLLFDALGHPGSGRSDKDHSQSSTVQDRSVNANGGWMHVNTRKHQTNTRPLDSRFLDRAVNDDDEEFLDKLRKSYNRLQKAGNRRLSSRIRHRKMTGSSDKSGSGLCVVGQSFISVVDSKRSTANNGEAKNTASRATSADGCSEFNDVSQWSHRQAQVRRLHVVIGASQNCVPHSAAETDASSDSRHVDVTTDLFQSCGVDVTGHCRPGKILILAVGLC